MSCSSCVSPGAKVVNFVRAMIRAAKAAVNGEPVYVTPEVKK